jgi:hypothetical protein
MAGKSPGFWFFTGDWLKDPELRFCSIFARGLLVDLLCILFEANERGYASKPDGTPAISGGAEQEKLAALAELEQSGVLSRDNRGVLFSRRLARLNELSKNRSKAGSKGGSKTQAKAKQTGKQNTGVTDSVSVSVSDSDISLSLSQNDYEKRIDPKLLPHWLRWREWRRVITGQEIDAISAETKLMDLERRGIDKAIRDIEFTILKEHTRSILDSDNDYEKQFAQRNARPSTAKPKVTLT